MTDTGYNARWYALYVRSNQEHMVATRLTQLGQEQFLPMHSVLRRKSTTQLGRTKPLFPGYVFCRIDWNNGPKLYTIPGIIRVVGAGKIPAPIPECEIEAVRRLVASGMPIQCLPLVQVSNPVIVKDGPFQGIKGIVVGERNTRSLIVSVPLLRRSLSVVLDRSWLEPVTAQSA